ncbi:NAD(P)H-hydrate epimerase [Chryseolinea serpens]|uniref:Bifunctional NAD(P)H-hydrate repair enzyme n=1 Tax=Chryseolinea serpens TaxID=947013 RepID=A0A1M5U3G3_9BACT|nr:bifunctional ADP-dependent NAD(P)H-hydrate dehydratase/NAD(P)H-hydrate epimerase [Chryseolinea serpens]SHH57504.1 NAD(P)H-hydrate epimerase [Chryseolinea serpens]
MQPILTASQIKALDAYTIAHEPIVSIDLMERACRAFVAWFTERFNNSFTVGIVCGTGNNGGDGLGIARLLKEWGYPVRVWLVKGGAPESIDFKINLDRLKHLGGVQIDEITAAPECSIFSDEDILIDAIFGTGLSRPVEGVYTDVIACMNTARGTRVAVDLPSGFMADEPTTGPSVEARYTVSFQLPKLAFFFPSSFQYVGEWAVVDISLNKAFIRQAQTSHFFMDRNTARSLLRRRSKFDHKGNFGHALLVAGSLGKMGAAVLSARATLRSGVGLLTVHTPQAGISIVQTAVPEAMLSIDGHASVFAGAVQPERYTTIGIGPGLGKAPETVKAFHKLLENFPHPMVIDADALNILGENRELLHLVPKGSILTPHPKEFERLVGPWQNDFERLEKQKGLAAQLQSVVVLKGAFTSIAAPDGKTFFNPTGNPGMATGGSGDVLTGILTGLLAQRYDTLEGALLGVYLHGFAGDLGAWEKGMDSLIASDIVEFLSGAFARLGG